LKPKEEDIPLHGGVETHQPKHATVRFASASKDKKLTDSKWNLLSNDLYQTVLASLSARGALNANLKEWSDAYDMVTSEKDWPFVNSSNLALPYTAGQLESLHAYLAGQVFTPRPFIVTGRNTDAVRTAPMVENFYNGEWQRLRSDGSSYFQKAIQLNQLALRDGVGILEVLWTRRRHRREVEMSVPMTDENGQVVFGPDGQPQWDVRRDTVDIFVKDYPEWRCVPLKEFILIPDEAPSIEEAAGVACVEWLYEDDLDRMVRAGLLDSDEVEKALRYDENGTSDVASDPEGTYDKSASYQIGLGQGQGSMSSPFFKNRGPLKVWRIHSRQFDMNEDGMTEENIFWLHELSQKMLGWVPYDYADGRRPFFSYCPFPRADNFYGYSLVERLAGIETELRATHNARNDRIQFGLFPPMAVPTGSEILTRKGRWYPGEMIETDFVGADPAVKIMQIADVPISSWQEESALKQYGTEYTGLNMPMIGAQSSGKRSATEMRQQNSAAGTRLGLLATRLRVALGQIINFTHALNKQYLQTDPETMVGQQTMKIDLQTLAKDYLIGVAGASDPIDSITRRQESLAFFQIAMSIPWIAQSPLKQYYWVKMLGDSFNRQDLQLLIGTEQEAQQREEQQQQQAQTQAQQGGPPGGGQPGQQQPQRPPQPQGQPGRPAGQAPQVARPQQQPRPQMRMPMGRR